MRCPATEFTRRRPGVELKLASPLRLEVRRDLAGATPVGLRQRLRAAAEQVVRSTRAPEQALLGGDVRLDRPVDQNVSKRQSALRQRAGDQEATMAVERLPPRPPRAPTQRAPPPAPC